jgi:hypothetical protein
MLWSSQGANAQVAWFQANLDLGFSVSFPVIASLPGVIGSPGNKGCRWLFIEEKPRDPQTALVPVMAPKFELLDSFLPLPDVFSPEI